jgi:sporulation protein YlmC with PRC-barrel domain
MNPDLLKGRKVVGTEGYILGEVDGFDVDSSIWQAVAFYVSLSEEAIAELGFKKPFLRKIVICLPTHLIKEVGDIVTLNEPIRNLKDITEKEICVDYTKLDGKKVVSSKGYVVGDVEGLDVEVGSWQVKGLEVGLTDDAASKLGFKRPFLSKVVVIIPSEVVIEVGNFVTLDKAIEDLASLVECIKSCQRQNKS